MIYYPFFGLLLFLNALQLRPRGKPGWLSHPLPVQALPWNSRLGSPGQGASRQWVGPMGTVQTPAAACRQCSPGHPLLAPDGLTLGGGPASLCPARSGSAPDLTGCEKSRWLAGAHRKCLQPCPMGPSPPPTGWRETAPGSYSQAKPAAPEPRHRPGGLRAEVQH